VLLKQSGLVRSHSRSPVNRSYDFLSVRHCKHTRSSTLYHVTSSNTTTLNLGHGHSRSSEMTSFHRSHTSWHSIVIMALSCVISEIKRCSGQKSQLFIPHLHSSPPLRGSRQIYTATKCGSEKIERWVHRTL